MRLAAYTLFAALVIAVTSVPAFAQIRPGEDDVPKKQKIYSP